MAFRQRLIAGILGIGRAVGAKFLRYIGGRVFRREAFLPRDRPLHGARQVFGAVEDADEPVAFRKLIAAGQRQERDAGRGAAQKRAPREGRQAFHDRPPMSYQPVIIERRLFQTPDTRTMTRWMTTKPTKGEGDDEMDRARRLPPAENLEEYRIARIHRRRHRQPGQDHDRAEDERDDEIGQLLDDVVALGLFALGKAQPQMIPERARDMARSSFARRHEIARQMAADDRECRRSRR